MGYDEDALKLELIRDEGKRMRAYKDILGNWTIGVGHLLLDKELQEWVDVVQRIPRKTLSEAECAAFLAGDIADAEARLTRLLPAWRGLDDVRQRALLNLTFNLGLRLGHFVAFLRYVEDGYWALAAKELRNSKWWKQVATRGPRIARMIEFGVTE